MGSLSKKQTDPLTTKKNIQNTESFILYDPPVSTVKLSDDCYACVIMHIDEINEGFH